MDAAPRANFIVLLHRGEFEVLDADALVWRFECQLEFISSFLELHGDGFGLLPVAEGKRESDLVHVASVSPDCEGLIHRDGDHGRGEIIFSSLGKSDCVGAKFGSAPG